MGQFACRSHAPRLRGLGIDRKSGIWLAVCLVVAFSLMALLEPRSASGTQRLTETVLSTAVSEAPGEWSSCDGHGARGWHFDQFRQLSPAIGKPATQLTRLCIWHDDQFLHVHIEARDEAPEGIIARQRRRDQDEIFDEDHLSLVIDPSGRGRDGHLFVINPLGAQFDALIYDGGQLREDWDARWYGESRVDEHGWQAWLRIPLSTFGRASAIVQGGEHWQVNAERWMPARQERVRLAVWQPDRPIESLGDGILMAVSRSVPPGWGLQIKAAMQFGYQSAAASGTGRPNRYWQPGLELFHETERGLRSALAVNLDFSDTEADEREVNLSRFELFRPEKRAFFLRDAGLFSFGGLKDEESPILPFYSRRIGLDPSGRPRSLAFGLKLSGSLAGTELGLLTTRVAGGPVGVGLPEQPRTDVGVLRAARVLAQHHRVGLIGTRGNPEGVSGSHTWGVDYQFQHRAWQPPWEEAERGVQLDAWMLSTANPGEGQVRAWGGGFDYDNLGLTGHAQFQHVDEGFRPALGYLSQPGMVHGEGMLGWWHRSAQGQDLRPELDWMFQRDLDGRARNWQLNPELEYVSAQGDAWLMGVFIEQETLASALELLPGIEVGAGRYAWRYGSLVVDTAASRPVSLYAEWRHGGFYDGRRQDQLIKLSWRPDPDWSLRLALERKAIRLPGGRFTVRAGSVRLDLTPSTELMASLLLQWDNVSKELGASARLRWQCSSSHEWLFSFDHLGHTGELRRREAPTSRAMLKLVWYLDR